MSSYTLDDIRAAADAQYGHTDIQVGDTEVRLINALRLKKERRQALEEVQKRMSDEPAEGADGEKPEAPDTAELMAEAVRIVARSSHEADVLLEACKNDGEYDAAVLATVFNKYVEGTEAGEASPSAG